jgi:hypothetical protein
MEGEAWDERMALTRGDGPVTPKPPVIVGDVPPDYRGPLYYRLLNRSAGRRKKPLQEMIKFDDRKLGDRLASVNPLHAAVRRAPQLCDPNGELLSDLREPLKARLKSSASKGWDEFSSGVITLVSPRIRNVIEGLAPDVHYFVPIDISGDEGAFRVYAFYCGLSRQYPALALEANGIGYSLAENGVPVFTTPHWLETDSFAYLDASVIAGVPLLLDWKVWLIFSAELVEALGDVMPAGTVFVPMGLDDKGPRLNGTL